MPQQVCWPESKRHDASTICHQLFRKWKFMAIVTGGFESDKNIFAIDSLSDGGRAELKPHHALMQTSLTCFVLATWLDER
jgi:hypothetical protein